MYVYPIITIGVISIVFIILSKASELSTNSFFLLSLKR